MGAARDCLATFSSGTWRRGLCCIDIPTQLITRANEALATMVPVLAPVSSEPALNHSAVEPYRLRV